MKRKIFLYELEAEEGKVITDAVICENSDYYKKITTPCPENFQEMTFEEYEKEKSKFIEIDEF